MDVGLKVVIAGGSGFLGHALIQEFKSQNYDVVVLSRSGKPISDATVAKWDGKTLGNWASHLDGATAVLNVVGENVFTHWTDEKKREFISSRVDPTRVLGEAIKQCNTPPQAWVNASAVGYYGSVYEPTTEIAAAGTDYLAEVCKQWEAAQIEADCPATHKSRVRIGFVLGKEGGAFPILRKLTASFLGSAQGDGNQWVGWIHVEDVARIFRFCVEHGVDGPINATAPSPLENNAFMARLRQEMHRPWVPNVPKFALKLGSLVALPPPEVTLSSQHALPKRALELGYKFRFPTLYSALKDLLA
jgi:uncharacterized protein (TIGR01777 family)